MHERVEPGSGIANIRLVTTPAIIIMFPGTPGPLRSRAGDGAT
jgi:hypothetical protein